MSWIDSLGKIFMRNGARRAPAAADDVAASGASVVDDTVNVGREGAEQAGRNADNAAGTGTKVQAPPTADEIARANVRAQRNSRLRWGAVKYGSGATAATGGFLYTKHKVQQGIDNVLDTVLGEEGPLRETFGKTGGIVSLGIVGLVASFFMGNGTMKNVVSSIGKAAFLYAGFKLVSNLFNDVARDQGPQQQYEARPGSQLSELLNEKSNTTTAEQGVDTTDLDRLIMTANNGGPAPATVRVPATGNLELQTHEAG